MTALSLSILSAQSPHHPSPSTSPHSPSTSHHAASSRALHPLYTLSGSREHKQEPCLYRPSPTSKLLGRACACLHIAMVTRTIAQRVAHCMIQADSIGLPLLALNHHPLIQFLQIPSAPFDPRILQQHLYGGTVTDITRHGALHERDACPSAWPLDKAYIQR